MPSIHWRSYISPMIRFTICLAITALAVASLAAVVVADTQRRTDPKGDTKGQPRGEPFDFRSAGVRHVDVWGRVAHRAASWSAAGPTGVALALDTDDRRGADWAVVKFPGKRAAVRNLHTGKRAAGVRLRRHSSKSFSFIFNLKFAGNPPSYK